MYLKNLFNILLPFIWAIFLNERFLNNDQLFDSSLD